MPQGNERVLDPAEFDEDDRLRVSWLKHRAGRTRLRSLAKIPALQHPRAYRSCAGDRRGALGWVVRTAIAQRDAVAAITKVRGQAFYELNPTDEVLAWKKVLAFRRLVGECIVIDFVFQVMSVDIEVTAERFDAARQQALARVGDLVRLKDSKPLRDVRYRSPSRGGLPVCGISRF